MNLFVNFIALFCCIKMLHLNFFLFEINILRTYRFYSQALLNIIRHYSRFKIHSKFLKLLYPFLVLDYTHLKLQLFFMITNLNIKNPFLRVLFLFLYPFKGILGFNYYALFLGMAPFLPSFLHLNFFFKNPYR